MLNIFMFLLAICMSNLEKYLSRSYAHFLNWIVWGLGFFLSLLSCMSCLYILEMNLLPVTSFENISSHSIG